jgi:hypothetical protein
MGTKWGLSLFLDELSIVKENIEMKKIREEF